MWRSEGEKRVDGPWCPAVPPRVFGVSGSRGMWRQSSLAWTGTGWSNGLRKQRAVRGTMEGNDANISRDALFIVVEARNFEPLSDKYFQGRCPGC